MEQFPTHNSESEKKPEDVRRQERIEIANELYESGEEFEFPGLAADVQQRLEAEEVDIQAGNWVRKRYEQGGRGVCSGGPVTARP